MKIGLLAILQKSLDRAIFLYIVIHEVLSSGVRASILIVRIRIFYKMKQTTFDSDYFLNS